jgi:hypothetical protein
MLNNTTGAGNSAFGRLALLNNTTGYQNTALGVSALRYNTTGANNTSVGVFALQKNTSGARNIAVGLSALINNTTGVENVAMGVNAMYGNTSGYSNVGIGYRALVFASGIRNIAVGQNALANATGTRNIGIGIASGCCITSGACNVILGGASANGFGTQNCNIFISDGAGNIRIFTQGSTGNTGVGTTSPTQKLDVAGALSISGSVVDYEVAPALISPGPGSNIVSFTPGTHYAAFVDYVIKDGATGANQRVGTIMVSISLAGAAAVMNETVTTDIGNTSAITFSVTYGAPTWLSAANSGITPYDINYMVRYF